MDFDLKFLKYTNPVVAGSEAEVAMSLSPTSVEAKPESEDIDVHVGFQGSYSWGDFPYVEGIEEINLGEAPSIVDFSITLDIPYKTLIEFDCQRFSYYAYITPKGGRWTQKTTVAVSDPIEVEAPKTVTREELEALIAQVIWLVENSALSNKVKEGLTSPLQAQVEGLSRLEEPATTRAVRGSLESFSRELESGRARRYRGSKLWAKQIRFTIARLQKLRATRTLERVPEDMAFRFYRGIGSYTGVTAESLSDFLDKLATIDLRVLEFHLPRKDFENWIRGVLGDEELADELGRIGARGLSGENLRSAVLDVLRERYAELQRIGSET
jgi:hypothetical protein